jgi:hypothetical protein
MRKEDHEFQASLTQLDPVSKKPKTSWQNGSTDRAPAQQV